MLQKKCNVCDALTEQWGVRHDFYARMGELPSKFEGGEAVDVGALSRRVRRENPDITSLETGPASALRFDYYLKNVPGKFLSHFQNFLELRVPRRPRSFA